MQLLSVALRCAVVYLTLLGALRLAGKRHAGQVSPHDLVVMLLVANGVQNAMVGGDTSLAAGLVAAGTLLALNVAITRLIVRGVRLGPLIAARPSLLIHNGLPILDQLSREGILLEELEAKVRGRGFVSLEEVRFAVQESDGSISVIGFEETRELRLPPKTAWRAT